jgi:hypothetical protein
MAGPVKGSAYTMTVRLLGTSTGAIVLNPTLAAGDVKVKKDDGAYGDITTLPTCISGDGAVKVSLSTSETNADRVSVRFIDAAGSEWRDLQINIETETYNLTTLGVAIAAIPAAVWAVGTRTLTALGFQLADGDFNYEDDGNGPASGFLSRTMQVWHWLIGRKTTLNRTEGKMTLLKENGTDPCLEMDIDDDGEIQTKAAADEV